MSALGDLTRTAVIGLIIMAATLACSIVFTGEIGVGMPDQYYMVDKAYLQDLMRSYETLTRNSRPAAVNMAIDHLDLNSAAALTTFSERVLTPIMEKADTLLVSCLPAMYVI